jgi:hypothetical protein
MIHRMTGGIKIPFNTAVGDLGEKEKIAYYCAFDCYHGLLTHPEYRWWEDMQSKQDNQKVVDAVNRSVEKEVEQLTRQYYFDVVGRPLDDDLYMYLPESYYNQLNIR